MHFFCPTCNASFPDISELTTHQHASNHTNLPPLQDFTLVQFPDGKTEKAHRSETHYHWPRDNIGYGTPEGVLDHARMHTPLAPQIEGADTGMLCYCSMVATRYSEPGKPRRVTVRIWFPDGIHRVSTMVEGWLVCPLCDWAFVHACMLHSHVIESHNVGGPLRLRVPAVEGQGIPAARGVIPGETFDLTRERSPLGVKGKATEPASAGTEQPETGVPSFNTPAQLLGIINQTKADNEEKMRAISEHRRQISMLMFNIKSDQEVIAVLEKRLPVLKESSG